MKKVIVSLIVSLLAAMLGIVGLNLFKDAGPRERMKAENLQKYWVRYCLATNANGYSVSQYFKMGNTEIQLRTSGFAKFADQKIPQEVLNGSKSVSITGVLTMYEGSIQLVINDLSDIVVE